MRISMMLWLAVTVASGGCGSGISGPEACNEVADAFSSATARCGGDPVFGRSCFVSAAADGSCDNVVSLRDQSAFENDCLPFFRTATCDQINAAQLPDSCKNQLERTSDTTAACSTAEAQFNFCGVPNQGCALLSLCELGCINTTGCAQLREAFIGPTTDLSKPFLQCMNTCMMCPST